MVRIVATASLAFCLALPAPADAGVKLQIADDSFVDLGFQFQGFYLNTERNIDDDGALERYNGFVLRRSRIRLKGEVTPYVQFFQQTEVTPSGNGIDVVSLDAWVRLKPFEWASLFVGQMLPAASRQGITSPATAMTLDRPAVALKSLTWGARAIPGFVLNSYEQGDSGLRGGAGSRDVGAVLFGSIPAAEIFHVNYWLSVFEGIQNAGQDNQRFTGRLQLNLFDPETNYTVWSTYLGGKRTLALGASIDFQNAVDIDDATGETIDYRHYTVDGFLEYPVGPGWLTVEVALSMLDLGEGGELRTAGGTASQAAGRGVFGQLGYLIGAFQPWLSGEAWESDATDGRGSFWAASIGLNYLIKEHNARLIAGYDLFRSDRKIGASRQNLVGTFSTAIFVNY